MGDRKMMPLVALMLVCAISTTVMSVPLCDKNFGYVVESCVRYRCLYGVPVTDPCPAGLLPSNKIETGCNWPRDSECGPDKETGRLTDPCDDKPCRNGGKCIPSMGKMTYICVCAAGYEGPNCATETDECMSSPCMNGGTCVDKINGFACDCPSNIIGKSFSGNRCEIEETNTCASSPCLNGGTCVDKPEGFACLCLINVNGKKYVGKRCEIEEDGSTDPCFNNPCKNGGFCFHNGNVESVRCFCRPEFTGPTCEQRIDQSDPCFNRPCLNNGYCIKNDQGFKCFCGPGFTGARCENKQDPCLAQPCGNGGTCTQSQDSALFKCLCRPGYKGLLCDEVDNNGNPCASRPCKNSGFCLRKGDTFRCQCLPGFTGPDCDLKIEAIVSGQCQGGQQLIPHPDYCQLFYNCSDSQSKIPGNPMEKHLDECQYPQLFNANSAKCEHFTLVNCGNRKKIINYCDYFKQTCLTACKPCHIDWPSCEGMMDGAHPNKYKLNTPYYIVCFKDRTIASTRCDLDRFGVRMIFYEKTRVCTSVYDIPTVFGGRLPSCSDDSLSIHADPVGECSMYYYCENRLPKVMKCPDGQVFVFPACVNKDQVCPPCGTRTAGCRSGILGGM